MKLMEFKIGAYRPCAIFADSVHVPQIDMFVMFNALEICKYTDCYYIRSDIKNQCRSMVR